MYKYVASRYKDNVFYELEGTGTIEAENIKEAAVKVFQEQEEFGRPCKSIKICDHREEHKFFREGRSIIDSKTGKKISDLEKKSLDEKQ